MVENDSDPMKFKGKILCNKCRTVLNQSAERVPEHEKAWAERQAIWMVMPNCDHVSESDSYIESRIYTEIIVEWEPWEDVAP